MKIIVLGADGYIGYPLTLHLLNLGHEVATLDNNIRRARVNGVGSNSLTPILPPQERIDIIKSKAGYIGSMHFGLGINDPGHLRNFLHDIKPDAIVHLAEQPSAPWSMIDPYEASNTQQENVIGTLHLLWAIKEECPKAHLVKLGTMGEYGTPKCDIPEGMIPKSPCAWIPHEMPEKNFLKLDKKCPMSGLLFPRQPGSFYHASKVHDTYNIEFACRNWGLRSTDIMQGVVFGLIETELEQITRFDYDEYFGTAINRFCAQALIEHPLTVYGLGKQTRGFLTLSDSIQCLTIAIENPPDSGEYRTFNQFENIYSINSLAIGTQQAAKHYELNVSIDHIPNPRKEDEEHYYNPIHQKLLDLGYKPNIDLFGEIHKLIGQLLPYKDRVIKEVIIPRTNWR